MPQEYPAILLPRQEYRSSIDFSKYGSGLCLIRRSRVPKEDITNDLGTVRTHAIINPDEAHLFFSLSLNLFGLFNETHLVFKLGGDSARKRWIKGGSSPQTQIDFSVEENSTPIYLEIDKIQKQPFTLKKGNHKGKITQCTGESRVEHAPLEANYWHLEFRVADETGVDVKSSHSNLKVENAVHFVESYLKLHFKLACRQPYALEESIYLEVS